MSSELFIARTIVKRKKSTPLQVASSLRHLLFVHGNQRIMVQSVIQKIMALDLPQRRKVGPVIRQLVWSMLFSVFYSLKLMVSY